MRALFFLGFLLFSGIANANTAEYNKCMQYFKNEVECSFQTANNYPYKKFKTPNYDSRDPETSLINYFSTCRSHFSTGYCASELSSVKEEFRQKAQEAFVSNPAPSDFVQALSAEDAARMTKSGQAGFEGGRMGGSKDGTLPSDVDTQNNVGRTSQPSNTSPAPVPSFQESRAAVNARALAEKYQASGCEDDLAKAKQCCGQPESCLGESIGSGSGGNAYILGALQLIAGTASQVASISGACSTMRDIGTGVAAVNTILAFRCSQKVNSCRKSCGEMKKQAQDIIAECNSNKDACAGVSPPVRENNPSFATQNSAYIQERRESIAEITGDMNRIISSANECSNQENGAMAQAQQAIASAYTAKLMGLCKNSATSASAVSAANAAFNVDCSSAANTANPACQNVCNRAGAQNDPACNPNLAGNGYGTGTGAGTLNPNLNGSLGAGIDELENAQSALADGGKLTPNKAQLGTGSGGGGVGGGGGDSGGGLGTMAAGGPEGSAFDPKNVSTGFRSGGGYSAPGGRAPANADGGGGIGGFTAAKTPNGQPFNPKDYLPGGRLDPKRKLAGLAATTPEIGAVHGDIFRSITNRFYQICLRDGLYDCATLRRSGTQGN